MKIYQTDYANVFFGNKRDSLIYCEKLAKNSITFGHQVHEAELIKINKTTRGSKCITLSSDGLFTEEKNLPLGLYTADCIPCVLATKNQLFNLHLGWRGIYNGLLKKALSLIKSDFEVFIGPHILYDSFKVQEDLIKKFKELHPNDSIWSKKLDGNFHISLVDLIKLDLSLKHFNYRLYFNEEDTFISPNHFSYRANKTKERNLTFSFLRT